MTRERNNWAGYLFVAPATIYLLIFAIVPMALAAWLSLHRWSLLSSDRPFVGLSNYVDAFRDPFFRNAIFNTLIFAMFSVPLGMAAALAAAMLVNHRLPGVKLFRTIFYIPAIGSNVAMAMVWTWIFMPGDGLINFFLRLTGLSGTTDFLNDTRFALPAIILMTLFTGLGPKMVIFLAGLQGIPDSLYESAEIDGAGMWHRFWHITLPMLAPTTLFVLVTSTIAAFEVFTPVYVMTRGGPRRTTDVVVYHIYKEAWQKFQIGSASAQTYIIFLAILAVAIVQFRMMRSEIRDLRE